jgi:phosphatidylethanolamine/phosphatidyl-N-methylethanolamine N-methyltransferase
MSSASPKKNSKRDEKILFFKRLLKNPVSMGAVVPSSLALANFICRHVKWAPGEFVVELGAGTGRFTQALINHGLPEAQLIAVELDPELAQYLRQKFPKLTVIEGDATQVENLLPDHIRGKVRTVLSGIPMVNMPKEVLSAIVQSSFAALIEQGVFLQFTYGPMSPLPARSLGLEKKRLGHILFNFPPATVWSYKRANTWNGQEKKNFVNSIKRKIQRIRVIK